MECHPGTFVRIAETRPLHVKPDVLVRRDQIPVRFAFSEQVLRLSTSSAETYDTTTTGETKAEQNVISHAEDDLPSETVYLQKQGCKDDGRCKAKKKHHRQKEHYEKDVHCEVDIDRESNVNSILSARNQRATPRITSESGCQCQPPSHTRNQRSSSPSSASTSSTVSDAENRKKKLFRDRSEKQKEETKRKEKSGRRKYTVDDRKQVSDSDMFHFAARKHRPHRNQSGRVDKRRGGRSEKHSGIMSPSSTDLKNYRQLSGVFEELERIYGAVGSASRPMSHVSHTKSRGQHSRPSSSNHRAAGSTNDATDHFRQLKVKE